MKYEFQIMNEKLSHLKGIIKNKASQEDILFELKDLDILRDRFRIINIEVEGAKRKFMFEIKRIEEKMEAVENVKK